MCSWGNTEIKLLISVSASSVKVKGLSTSASKHIALAFLVAVSGYILLQYIQFRRLQDEACEAR